MCCQAYIRGKAGAEEKHGNEGRINERNDEQTMLYGSGGYMNGNVGPGLSYCTS